jgi:hypothetical protein
MQDAQYLNRAHEKFWGNFPRDAIIGAVNRSQHSRYGSGELFPCDTLRSKTDPSIDDFCQPSRAIDWLD